MKKLAIIKSICSVSILAAAVFSQSALAANKITFEEFSGMNYEDRVKTCAQYVDSADIGLCAALKSKPSAAASATSAARNKALVECAKEENTTSPQALTSCADDKLDSETDTAKAYTDAQFHTALKACAKDKSLSSTNAVLQCTYGKLRE